MKALYRKYRPRTLDEVVGQDKIISILKSSINEKKINHAYLFTGPRGTGKTSVARIFAHEINGFPYELEDSYIDIIEIDAASNTGVENIRELREKAMITPTKGQYKVYIIDEVHMLSKSAFNALLKILEEPPRHVVFILATTDYEKVPITITSRVQTYVFSLASQKTMQEHLKKICKKEKLNIEDSALDVLVRRGGGSFRDTLSLLDQIAMLNSTEKEITKKIVNSALGLAKDEQIYLLLNAFTEKNLEKISDTLKSILNSGTKAEIIAEEIINIIIDKPNTEFLPLLEKLINVKGDFPEAKLLLALTSFNHPQNVQNIASTRTTFIQKLKESKQNREETQSKAKSNSQKPELKNKPIPEENKPDHEPKTEEKPTESQPNPNEFTWDIYLNSVKKVSTGTAMWLKKCRFSLENQCLNLYPPSPTVRGILESENNRKVLKDCLENYSLKIHESSDFAPKTEKKDPKITTIDDIMGKTTEVNDGGELPF